MTTAADDSAVEEAFEAYLAGRSAPGAPGLVSFADAVRASATEPGRPNAALAELLATGLLVDQPGPAARPARRPRRRRTRMLAAALFTKLASAGLAAKAATVAGVAVVGLTTVGFTGNLGPVQHGFATLVDHATPFTAPDPSTDPSTGDEPITQVTEPTSPVTPTATPTPEAGDGTSSGDGQEATESAHPSNFGQKVSDAAHNGGVDGQQVSQWAHEKNDERKAGTAATPPSEPTQGPEVVRTSAPSRPTSGGSHATGHGGPKR